jgi:threonine dehydrogenase-like Zn-dependent dehydrogenase
VQNIRLGQFVVGSFWASDNTCELCQAGYQSSCVQRVLMGTLGAQAQLLRVPLADGTLVATPDLPPDDLVPSLLAASDVLGTGWFGAVAAKAGPGKTVAVVGDGAVGLLAVLAARQLRAERIIAMSRHQPRQQLAREYGGDRYCHRARRRGGGPDQGAHRGAGGALGRRGGRDPGVDAAGHPVDRAGRARRLRRRGPWGGAVGRGAVHSPPCTCTAGRRRCAASCPSCST